MTTLRRIDGIVDLPIPLHVEAEALGGRVSVNIGQYKGMIGLPALPDSGIPKNGQVSFLNAPVLGARSLPDLTLHGSPLNRWGYISSSRGDTFIERIWIRIPLGDSQESVPDQMGHWAELLMPGSAWFAIGSAPGRGQLWDRDFYRKRCHVSATVRLNGKPGLYGSGVSSERVTFGENAATRDQVLAAFRCASKHYNIPLPYAFLLRSRSDRANGDFRQAIINACTAAEVSLSSAVEDALNSAKVRERTVVNIMRQSSGVVEIFRILIATGAPTPVSDDRVMDQSAKPRNDAVHAGARSTEIQAARAIETASLIVEAATPLPNPAQAKHAAHSSNPVDEAVS